MSVCTIRDTFYIDEQPVKIISGAIHYFRTVPEYWLDRLVKLKELGCNTVETYIPWNLHEPEKGQYCFDGILDIVKFVKLAEYVGLYVILRPSPYICAEWEFGGLPAWLISEEVRLRTGDPKFIGHVKDYYDVLIPQLVPLQCNFGGPVILMQVENEYGYFNTDHHYLEVLQKMLRNLGIVVPFVTSDNPIPECLKGGSIKGALPTGNFGSRAEERFAELSKMTAGGPLMCTEFWVGWFDHWGNGGHMTGNLEQSCQDLEKLLELGHVNIYMFEGGTNFGFMNGSNYYDALTPDVTSYDYDGILTEDGRITEKYRRYQEIIYRYLKSAGKPLPRVTIHPEAEIVQGQILGEKILKKKYGEIPVSDRVSLFSVLDQLSKPTFSRYPVSMEVVGQKYGYILYRSILDTTEHIDTLRLWEANDRANIFVGEKPVCVLYDRELLEEVKPDLDIEPDSEFNILVENMGRVNFGPRLERQRKGINHCVQINGHMQAGWMIYPLPLTNVDQLDFTRGYEPGTPSFHKFLLEVDEPGDTYLDFAGWGKGCVFVNGFNIGRYWEIGPQKRLYIPGTLLQKGENEIIVFETEGKTSDTITLVNQEGEVSMAY